MMMVAAAAVLHAFMSNDYRQCNPGGHGPSPTVYALLIMTSSTLMWRHFYRRLASSTAYRFSRGPWLSIYVVTSAAKLHAHCHFYIIFTFKHFQRALLPTSWGSFCLIFVHSISWGSACLSIFWWFMRLLPRLWFSSFITAAQGSRLDQTQQMD